MKNIDNHQQEAKRNLLMFKYSRNSRAINLMIRWISLYIKYLTLKKKDENLLV